MAENVNIGAIAEELSHELFHDFFWQPIGRMNHDWNCEQKDVHSCQKHPCDVVFYYDEPYAQVRTYLHTDLKSYSKESISKTAIENALISLAKQVACANISEDWQDEHTHQKHQSSIQGMLFIYNHDGEYDSDFNELLDKIDLSKVKLPNDSRIYVIGPEEINWFQLIKLQMQHYRGASRGFSLPSQDQCSFYYPQLSRKINTERKSSKAATLETLLAPWVILKHQNDNEKGYVVFYKRDSVRVEEFIYFIDYLRYYSLLDESYELMVVFKSECYAKALQNFQKAKQQYLEEINADSDSGLRQQVESINLDKFVKYTQCYSADEIGMNYE